MKLRALILSTLLCVAIAAGAQAKYIFYFIGDGMGFGQTMFTNTYKRLALNDKPLTMTTLPVQSVCTTYSASSPVTDSAAAGTALATGHKTRNGMLGMDADTIAVTSIATKLHDAGYGVAIVTTVAADDATPGAFYAHVPNRGEYYRIGIQAAESGFELIGGAQLRGTYTDGKPNDMMDAFANNGVDVAHGIAELAASKSNRVMLLPEQTIHNWNSGYTVDSVPYQMSIHDLTVASIKHLTRHTPEAFFIMAEAGNIDHAGHANDAGTIVKEVLAFDEAIEAALEFYNNHPDETLIIITADHETGGLSVGNQHVGYKAFPQYFIPQRMSKAVFSQYCDNLVAKGEKPTWEQMKSFMAENLGLYTEVPVNNKIDARLQEAFRLTFYEGQSKQQETLYANFKQFAVEVFDALNKIAGAGWTTTGHSGNPVPVYAIGVGAELFANGNDNTQIPGKIMQAAGL